MLISVLVVVAFVLMAFVALVLLGGRSSNKRSEQMRETDFLLSQAEARMLVGRHAEAEALFRQALLRAQSARLDLFASEALYGLARLENKKENFAEAIRYLEKAVELSESWKAQKPEFARLIRLELTGAREALSRCKR